jgi:hypothetical protein
LGEKKKEKEKPKEALLRCMIFGKASAAER